VRWYQKKHSPTHYRYHHPIFISFFHLPRSIASSLFKLRAWQSFAQPLCMSSLVYLLVWSPPPHIPYIYSPNQCSFRNTCPYHRNLFCCSINKEIIIIIINDNVYGAVIMTMVTARVHPVHLMNAERAPGGRQPSDQANRLGL